MPREFKVGDVVETFGRFGGDRQRGTIINTSAEGTELMVVDFGDNFRRYRYPAECTLITDPDNVERI